MPKTLAEVIKSLAIKSGAKEDNEALVNELSAPDFARLTLSDDLITQLENGLLSVDAAKNNHPDISKHYKGITLSGLDSEISSLFDELQVPDDVKAVVLNERSSFKRVPLLVKKIKELESAKKNTDDKGEKASLQTTINQLNAELRSTKDSIDGIKAEYDKKYKSLELGYKLNEMLGEYKTIYDELPKEARNAAINALISKTLQDKNAEFTTDENGQIKLIRKDGSNVFGDDNRPWNPQILIDQTLSQNKILKINDQKPPANQNGQGNTNNNVIADTNNPGNGSKKNTALSALINESMKDIDTAGKVAVM